MKAAIYRSQGPSQALKIEEAKKPTLQEAVPLYVGQPAIALESIRTDSHLHPIRFFIIDRLI